MSEGMSQPAPPPRLPPSAYPPIPAGWYPDPEEPDLLRWWNGVSWSDEDFAPNPGAAPTGNRLARWSRTLSFWALGVSLLFWGVPIGLTLVPAVQLQTLGVVLFWLGALPGLAVVVLAIVFGAIGLHRSSQFGERRAAVTGLVCGGAAFLLPAVLGVLVGIIAVVAAAITGH